MNNELDNLQLVLIPCREPIPLPVHGLYEKSYALWKLVWSETLKELDGVDDLYSNEFTRFDYASVILRNGDPISMMCYTKVDMRLDTRKDDSWFSSWPEEILQDEKKRSNEGLMASWFCTHPKYRKRLNPQFNINVSQVIIEVFGKLILDEEHSAGYGVTRNNRSVGKYGDNIGGSTVANSIAHGCDVNLVIVEPEIIKEKQFSYSLELKKLWNNRIDYRQRNIEQEPKDENTVRKTA